MCFNALLKLGREFISRRLVGRAFQSIGATLEKARSPKVLRFVLGTESSLLDTERVTRALSRSDRRSWRYSGAIPFLHFHANRMILYIILFSTGNQCKERMALEMWSLFFRSNTMRAAMFCTRCSKLIFLFVQPASKALQWSRREMTRAWTAMVHVWMSRHRLIRLRLYKK